MYELNSMKDFQASKEKSSVLRPVLLSGRSKFACEVKWKTREELALKV
jgi:hypothetical protein